MRQLLLLLHRLKLGLVCGQSSSDSSGLLWAEVEREVLLSLVEESQLVALGSVDDS